MQIGELAQRAAVGIDTIRYYERQCLLPQPLRTQSGYRSYAHDDIKRMRFIRRAKALGFTLTEIRELLALSNRRDTDMAGLKLAASQKVESIERKIAELSSIRDGLRLLVASCPGHGTLDGCPILDALAGDNA